jgi:hypothetical protein
MNSAEMVAESGSRSILPAYRAFVAFNMASVCGQSARRFRIAKDVDQVDCPKETLLARAVQSEL